MTEPLFFNRQAGLSLTDIVTLTGAVVEEGQPDGLSVGAGVSVENPAAASTSDAVGASQPATRESLIREASTREVSTHEVLSQQQAPGILIRDIATLDRAGPSDIVFFDNLKYASQLPTTQAAACFVGKCGAPGLPNSVIRLRVKDPYRAFVLVARALYEAALYPGSWFASEGISPGAMVHPLARLEAGVIVDPGAVIGPHAEIGSGTIIGPNATIGPHVRVGRDCVIGAGVSLQHSLIGNRVVIHPGCRIGQDGFGYVPGAAGHMKVPQVGRVIIQDMVEIGANTTVDRGAVRDTMIGEGTKIDNLVQIGHNAMIGRHCIIVSQCAIAGSAVLEDGVVLGARAGVNNHATVGAGAQIAGTSVVNGDVPAGARYGGTPAKPVKQWFREVLAVEKLAAREGDGAGAKENAAAHETKDEG